MIINTPHNWIQLFLKLPIITSDCIRVTQNVFIRQQYPHLHHHHHCDQGPRLKNSYLLQLALWLRVRIHFVCWESDARRTHRPLKQLKNQSVQNY